MSRFDSVLQAADDISSGRLTTKEQFDQFYGELSNDYESVIGFADDYKAGRVSDVESVKKFYPEFFNEAPAKAIPLEKAFKLAEPMAKPSNVAEGGILSGQGATMAPKPTEGAVSTPGIVRGAENVLSYAAMPVSE